MSAILFMRPFRTAFVEGKAPGLNGHLRWSCSEGLTLIELMIVVGIISVMAAIAIPSYISSRYKAKIAVAISEIKIIEKAVLNYQVDHDEFPDILSAIDMDQIADPWGNPYRYLRIEGGTTPGLNGMRRRDKNANPVNSDFDLYSMGRDGLTVPQFAGKRARDDIVRANNGGFYGLAEKH